MEQPGHLEALEEVTTLELLAVGVPQELVVQLEASGVVGGTTRRTSGGKKKKRCIAWMRTRNTLLLNQRILMYYQIKAQL